MRSPAKLVAVAALVLAGCGDADTVEVPDHEGAFKSSAAVRAERRAYDGAPPTIPHDDFRAQCSNCHTERGRSVSEVGFAPASPHVDTRYAGATTRCRQCHVPIDSSTEFTSEPGT